MCSMGNYLVARTLARRAQEMAELIGNLLEQAQTVGIEARCCLSIGDFMSSARLCRRARELLSGYGLEGTDADLRFQNFEAEIHLLKTEYPEARAIYAQIARVARPGHATAFDLLNLAVIDTAMGADTALVRKNLDAARLQLTAASGSPQSLLLCDAAAASLHLRDGDVDTARPMLERLFVKLRTRDEGATFCLERLADVDQGMYDIPTTLGWAGVYLGSALKTKNRLSIMKALRCLGQIVLAAGDETTASNLFQVALDGFTSMEVHSWMADCMVRLAEIHIRRGEILLAKQLLASARFLFGRCMQKQKVECVDAKLKALET
ncbi:hypothetical protein B0H19DRAFT_713516 [Mycena capillaripes]|nr:hypothetical protein B0H19DRAFT_713516 [Mycena capillaripes]